MYGVYRALINEGCTQQVAGATAIFFVTAIIHVQRIYTVSRKNVDILFF